MLTGLKQILEYAQKNRCAVGAFNTPNLEGIMAVLYAAEDLGQAVILNHAENHEAVMPLEVIGPIMVRMAEKAGVPVCVHLDHGETMEYLKKALDLGFTSVMYDGSRLSYQENVDHTRKAVELAKQYEAGVEAEIGVMKGSEVSGEQEIPEGNIYTDPMLAQKFVNETGTDALAASFGTVHGFYKEKPALNFELIEKLYKGTKKPLVMHGGSGISPEDYREAIKRGVRKINYYSYMSSAGVREVKKLLNRKAVNYYHDIASAAVEGMRKDVKRAMEIFACQDGEQL